MNFSIRYILVLLLGFFLLTSFRPEDKLLRKAIRQLEKGNLKEAKLYYSMALEKNPENYKANLGMGLLLSELLSNYAQAQPYLEKAYKVTAKDTVPALIYALGKCYQHNGEYEKALSYFNLLGGYVDVEEEIDIEKDVKKRMADCNYALSHNTYTPAKDWYIINAGGSVNTDMPEYVPVLTPQNELIFTSRRKDSDKEQLSYLDGKYFESMYIVKIENEGFKQPRRYTLPDQFKDSQFQKNHESVVSMSPDGKKLFTFHDNKIFEINMDDRSTQKPKKLLKSINFDYYQNHAFLTKDGKTLYFTSEAKNGIGGLDIYQSVKIKEGEWSVPVNLGPTVNTEFDEDAPFVTDDGKTLYFASTGHEGFGNFDIYKTEFTDGQWTKPVNLGLPINSPGHDIFLVLDSTSSAGYFSSSRNGGFGDMDIYKINYLNNVNTQCGPLVSEISLSIDDTDKNDFKNTVKVTIPSHYKVLSSEWKVNDKEVTGELTSFTNDYEKKGIYKVSSKVIAYCDTCFSPIVACNIIENDLERADTDTAKLVIHKDETTPSTSPVDLSKVKGELSKEQLASIGFDTQPVLFDFDRTELKPEYEKILTTNIEILKKYPDLRVEIIGYTDARGSETYNRSLSNRRASTVKKYLSASGIGRSQIKYSTGKGAKELVNDCGKDKECDEAFHQQNRRVIFRVYAK